MEVSSALSFLRIITWAVPVLTIVWVLLVDILRRSAAGDKSSCSTIAVLITAGVVPVVVTAFGLNALIHRNAPELTLWVNVLLGGFVSLVGLAIAAKISRLPLSGNDTEAAARQADTVPVALAMAVLLGAYLIPKHTSRPEDWLAGAALGAALFAGAFSLAARLRDSSNGVLRAASDTLEMLAVGCAVVSLGILIGKQHFSPEIKHAGDILPIYLAIALLVWLPLSLLSQLAFMGKKGFSAAAFVVYAALVAWLCHLTTDVNLLEASASHCFWTGLAAGLAAVLLHSAGLFAPGCEYRRQAGVIALLLGLTSVAMGLRILGGFGVALCAAGMLAAGPGWSLLAPWRLGREETLVYEFPTTITWVTAFMAVLIALRIWLEWEDTMNVALFAPYPFLGLTLGIALPFAVWALAAGNSPERSERPNPWLASACTIFGIIVIAGLVVVVSVIFREPAVRLFLAGLGAAGMAGAVLAASGPKGCACGPVASTGLMAGMLTLTASQALGAISAEAARPDKLRALIIFFVITLVLYCAVEVWRMLSARKARV